jgi:hypothetical protein
MDSNFSFLKEVEPELYQLAIVAEDLVHRSPTTAIRELRTFGERIVQRIAEESRGFVRTAFIGVSRHRGYFGRVLVS